MVDAGGDEDLSPWLVLISPSHTARSASGISGYLLSWDAFRHKGGYTLKATGTTGSQSLGEFLTGSHRC